MAGANRAAPAAMAKVRRVRCFVMDVFSEEALIYG
jgi:hypothetical protein